MEKLKNKVNQLRRRERYLAWTGKTIVDYVCNACMIIVLEPEKGCPRCAASVEKARAFRKTKQREKEALKVELGIPKRGRGRPKGSKNKPK